MKRILINAFSARIGGGRTYLVNLLSRLPEGEFEIYFYGPDDLNIPRDPRIIYCKAHFPMMNPVFRMLWEMFVLPSILKKNKVDILFCPGGVVNTRAPKSCKVITMFRNMAPFDQKAMASPFVSYGTRIQNLLRRKAMLKSIGAADLVIFISEFARSVIEQQTKVKSAVTIPHGISKSFLSRGGGYLPSNLSSKYFLYVSRFEFYKRHLELVQAYQALPGSIRNTFKLVIIGGHETRSGQAVKSYIETHRLEDCVLLLGEVPYSQLPNIYQGASLFLFPSVCENCPNIMLEAMASGIPVLSSGLLPMPEFGGEAVGYFNADDPKSIRDSILEILSNEELRQDRLERMKERTKLYSWSETARATWKIILEQ